jgi:hypothetical protein
MIRQNSEDEAGGKLYIDYRNRFYESQFRQKIFWTNFIPN